MEHPGQDHRGRIASYKDQGKQNKDTMSGKEIRKTEKGKIVTKDENFNCK